MLHLATAGSAVTRARLLLVAVLGWLNADVRLRVPLEVHHLSLLFWGHLLDKLLLLVLKEKLLLMLIGHLLLMLLGFDLLFIGELLRSEHGVVVCCVVLHLRGLVALPETRKFSLSGLFCGLRRDKVLERDVIVLLVDRSRV